MASNDEWWEAWRGFFVSVQQVALHRARARGGPIGAFVEHHAPEIVGALTADSAWRDVMRAVEEFRDEDHPWLEAALLAETLAVTRVNREALAADDTEDADDDSETVKKSFEDLLKLPDWIKKALKILNEILGLVK